VNLLNTKEACQKVGGHERIAVNSLPAIGAHERQVFDKLLWGLVTSTMFVRC
jgi:hypothetical protein